MKNRDQPINAAVARAIHKYQEQRGRPLTLDENYAVYAGFFMGATWEAQRFETEMQRKLHENDGGTH